MANDESRLVYSTDGGRVREPAGLARPKGRPQPAARRAPSVPDDGIVRIQRDSRGRKGKTTTTVTGVPGSEAELAELLKKLKQHCGAGGSLGGRTLEIQGDHRDRLLAYLTSLGYRAKLAGG